MTAALENKLNALRIPGKVINVSDNYFYTVFSVQFRDDIPLNRIKARKDDISLFLGSSNIDIETGKGQILLKVPKMKKDLLNIYDFTRDIFNNDYKIPLIIGKAENGDNLYYDLVKCPHLLVAGSTGSGKSVFMHSLILSCLYSGCNLAMIDVKKVEFSIYENIPHLVSPICYDNENALKLLENLCYTMDKRYETLKSNKCRNIDEYKNSGHNMNHIIIFIDELADLMLSNKNIEHYITRIAQLGRAAGIHLIVATQRPDSHILSGLIRVNIPSRVCFAVQKSTDSRIVLDCNGGENLNGNGDGLFLPIGSKAPIHFQAPFMTSEDIEKAVDMARKAKK